MTLVGQIDLKHTKKAKNNASDYKNNKKDLCIPRAEKGVGELDFRFTPTHRHSTRRAGGGREESPTFSQFLNCTPAKT